MGAQPTPSPAGPILVYGAYGSTGSLIAKAALQRGHDVVLAGADRHRLDRLSAETGARSAQASLDAPDALRRLVRNAACVIHAAGPFSGTFLPMLEACFAEAVPYVDLNGELDVFRAIEDFAGRRIPRIPVISGAGFGVAAGESAALHAAAMLAKPERIWLGLAPGLGQRSPGAVRSTLRMVAQGGAVVQNGQFVSERAGHRSFDATLAQRERIFVSMPLGELWAVHRSTGIANVVAGADLPVAERILLQSGVLGLLCRSGRLREIIVKSLARDSGPDSHACQSTVWARAEDSQGRAAEAVLTMGEGYQWSAEAAVRAAERVAIDPRPGLWTPGQYFGKEFSLEVPGTVLRECTACS